MKNYSNKKWSHYVKDIISSDLYSAVLLVSYLREADKYKTYVAALEVLEFKPELIPLIKLANMPEMIVVGKN